MVYDYFMKRLTLRGVVVVALAVLGLAVFAGGLWIWGKWHDEWSGYNASTHVSDGYCNVAVIPIVGNIIPYDDANNDGDGVTPPPATSADVFSKALAKAEADPNILGVLIRIDSPGGTPAASEAMAAALKATSLPSVALIREMGTSGAYLAATGADTIYASPFSDVGSIGITMSYLDSEKQNEKEGLSFVSLASAPYKDYGNPNTPLTTDERTLLERDLYIYHEQFVKEVAENRKLPVEDVEKIADGSSMPGSLALERKLIDALGGQGDTRAWFAKEWKVNPEDVSFCE